jgi:hypothetical protein
MRNLSCCDISDSYKQFHVKVFGIKLTLYSEDLKKGLVIFGILDDIIVEFLNCKFIKSKIDRIVSNAPPDPDFISPTFNKFVTSLTLKDFLIHDSEIDIYKMYAGYVSQNNFIRQKHISQLVKEFITDDSYSKRKTIMCLLVHSSKCDNQYVAYLLYDLLSNDSNGIVDTQEQTIIFDSLPFSIKQCFKQAMTKTIQYTNDLSNYDINKIPLEQQICLLKTTDSVKEKAMTKLKEVKAKAEDSGSKARQYLDGLLKIPFSVYKKEPILLTMDCVKQQFKDIYNKHSISQLSPTIPQKDSYTNVEIIKYIKQIQGSNICYNPNNETIRKFFTSGDKHTLINNISKINDIFNRHKKTSSIVPISNYSTTKKMLRCEIDSSIEICFKPENSSLLNELIVIFEKSQAKNEASPNINCDISQLKSNMGKIKDYMTEVKTTLDSAVYGHEKAKIQLERIIGQWINGEQDGYCFGFEGPPGVGKTSLAKRGLSICLKDSDGSPRPFSMIQIGGDSNGSTLHGHGYTYVGSTWGSIVQILIDKKCMNPIIFIDEIDKISRTEHGKEIIGILTHLLDPAQNDCFQDKYFTGIELDLSKALFILSYNDADAIDKVLLDRVHRIKFNNLSLEDKLVISKTHLLPDIYKKMGLDGIITLEDDVLKFIIDEYTLEAGVRKLKEILL